MHKLGLLVNLPVEARLKYEEYLLALVKKVSFLIKKSLVIDGVFEEEDKQLLIHIVHHHFYNLKWRLV